MLSQRAQTFQARQNPGFNIGMAVRRNACRNAAFPCMQEL